MTDLKKLAEAASKVASCPWESDSEKMTDAPYQHHEYVLFDAKGNRLLDTANSDPGFGLIEDEHGEDGYRAWNEPARVLMAYLVAAQPDVILNLIRERDEARKGIGPDKVRRDVFDLQNRALLLMERRAEAAEAALSAAREEVERYKIALADAIRRPMGVIPASADGLITYADVAAAEERRATLTKEPTDV